MLLAPGRKDNPSRAPGGQCLAKQTNFLTNTVSRFKISTMDTTVVTENEDLAPDLTPLVTYGYVWSHPSPRPPPHTLGYAQSPCPVPSDTSTHITTPIP